MAIKHSQQFWQEHQCCHGSLCMSVTYTSNGTKSFDMESLSHHVSLGRWTYPRVYKNL